MKLLTQALKKKLPALYTFDKEKDNNKIPVTAKLFTPWTNWTWYITEGEEQEDGSIMLFGLVSGFEVELGYFALSELEEIVGPAGLKIERDIHWEGTLADAYKAEGKAA